MRQTRGFEFATAAHPSASIAPTLILETGESPESKFGYGQDLRKTPHFVDTVLAVKQE